MKKIIHVNIPLKTFHIYEDDFKKRRLNPEIYLNSEVLDDYHLDDLKRVARILSSYNASVSIHGPFLDLNPGAIDFEIRKVTMKRFQQALDVAINFQPCSIVFHGGYNHWYYNGNKELWFEQSLLTWIPLKIKAQELHIPIAIENIFEEEPSTLYELMNELGDSYFGICFDIGHFHLFSKVSLDEWFKKIGKYIIELHLHDNFKSGDDHLPVGDGEIDFGNLFLLLKKYRIEPLYTIEVKNLYAVERSLAAIFSYFNMECSNNSKVN